MCDFTVKLNEFTVIYAILLKIKKCDVLRKNKTAIVQHNDK